MGRLTMLDILKRLFFKRLFPHMGSRCPNCGGSDVSASTWSSWVVDGPRGLKYKCRRCGHVWKVILRAGI